jgi:hypothetical protein
MRPAGYNCDGHPSGEPGDQPRQRVQQPQLLGRIVGKRRHAVRGGCEHPDCHQQTPSTAVNLRGAAPCDEGQRRSDRGEEEVERRLDNQAPHLCEPAGPGACPPSMWVIVLDQ